jgi:F420-dependent oxidoreductase-like protein
VIGPRLAEIARTAEDAGFASLWVMDHFFQIGMVGPPEDPMLEGYSALSYLAAVTRRVQLGTLVTGVIYRHPGILVKTATTLDVLSGGRAYLGIGAGWNEQESRGLGVPFPPLKERFEQLEEALQIAHQMWSDDRRPYTGKHFQLADPLNHPQPLARPHPPIMIGGGGRPYEAIERTALGTVHLATGAMSPGDVIAFCREMADVGIQHLIFNMPNTHELAPLELFGREIIPAVAEL